MLWNETSLVGTGLYTIPEASRLTKAPQPSIRRWLFGYRYMSNGVWRDLEPVWAGQVPRMNSALGLGFLDLMEVRFVHAFRMQGVSLHVIRLAVQRARQALGHDHPFARKRFLTDGRRIFAEVIDESGETQLLDLVRSQYAFHRFVKPSLYAGLEFSDSDQVLRWYPMHPKRQVVVDPQQAFGRPITVEGRVPTDTLAASVEVEGSLERTARLFEIPSAAVRAALQFERDLAA